MELERVITFEPMCVYFDTRLIYAELRNGSSDEITVRSISCRFKTEDDLDHSIKKPVNISLQAGYRIQQSIQFEVGLELAPSSNAASVKVEYSSGQMEPETATFPHTGNSIIIQNIPSRSSYFISHKIPEDTKLAQRLGHYLGKIGFDGYNAEADRRPGHDIWTEKIYPVIDRSVGFIVLWTAKAEACPEYIEGEIRYAVERGKRVMVLAEEGAKPPNILPTTTEYFEADGRIDERNLVAFARSIYNLYMTDRR